MSLVNTVVEAVSGRNHEPMVVETSPRYTRVADSTTSLEHRAVNEAPTEAAWTTRPGPSSDSLHTEVAQDRDGAGDRLPGPCLGFHEDQCISSEKPFIDAMTLGRCVFPEHARGLGDGQVVVGLDVGLKHDLTALVADG
ncbi:MAG: hypothetical protein ACYTAS_10870 [Planctomycetota bacterium]